jgi:hypothetical protein
MTFDDDARIAGTAEHAQGHRLLGDDEGHAALLA